MTERGRPGFTLLETLVVLAIVSVAMAVVLPALSAGFASLGARSAAIDIASALAQARERSLRDRSAWYAEAAEGGLLARSAEGRQAWRAVPSGVELEPGPIVAFYPDGVSSGGEIRLRSGDMAWSVKVAANGRTTIRGPR